MGNDIPVLSISDEPSEHPMWTMLYGNLMHPDYSHPVFFRHNGSPINLINVYSGQTVYLIGRGPSLGKFIENKKFKDLLLHQCITRYCMNSSPEAIGFQANIWSAVDRISKFSSRVMKDPNILKLIPMNRFQPMVTDNRKSTLEKTIAYRDGNKPVYACECSNTFGVQTFLLEDNALKRIDFGNAYLGTPAVLYGIFRGVKSVLLYALKTSILLGFRKIVLIGVDFDMSKDQPYYRQTLKDFSQFHVDHNNKLYQSSVPLLKSIFNTLKSESTQYEVDIVTANPIKLLPFIPVIDLKKELEKEIEEKTSI